MAQCVPLHSCVQAVTGITEQGMFALIQPSQGCLSASALPAPSNAQIHPSLGSVPSQLLAHLSCELIALPEFSDIPSSVVHPCRGSWLSLDYLPQVSVAGGVLLGRGTDAHPNTPGGTASLL